MTITTKAVVSTSFGKNNNGRNINADSTRGVSYNYSNNNINYNNKGSNDKKL